MHSETLAYKEHWTEVKTLSNTGFAEDSKFMLIFDNRFSHRGELVSKSWNIYASYLPLNVTAGILV